MLTLKRYLAYPGLAARQAIQYNAWFWVDFFGQTLMMMIFVFFWRAVYASTDTLGGLDAGQTITYILFARMLAPMFNWSLVLIMGERVHNGSIAMDLLKPVDLQMRWFFERQGGVLVSIVQMALPLSLVAWLLFGLRFPTDPLVWLWFVITFLLSQFVIFAVEWIFAMAVFYSTESWGLHTLREGILVFFSGSLIPLAILPGWVGTVAQWIPIGHGLYTPLSILTGIVPVSGAPRAALIQIAWIAVLWPVSHLLYRFASRKVTILGG